MAAALNKSYLLAGFELEPDARRLSRNGQSIHLTKKPFGVLLYLIENRGRMVTRRELLDAFWDGHDVYEETLTKCVGAIRKALGDNSENPQFIETLWAEGYRFIGEIEEAFNNGGPVTVVERTRFVEVTVEEDDEARPFPREQNIEIAKPVTRFDFSKRSVVFVSLGIILALSVGAWYFSRQSIITETSTAPIRSIAVLPLKSLSPESGDQYLGLGIADSIISRISQIGALTVRPTSAVRKYVNSEVDSLEAAREQKVDSVLDGTIQRSGDRLRVSVNLLKVSDGSSLWADTFNLSFNDIFAMQDEVSRQIAARLRLKLDETETARIAKRNTSSPEAYNYYAKAMYHFGNISPELSTRTESDLAIDLFKKAIELDPNYALAHAQLGYTYTRKAVFQEENPGLIALAKQELAIAERLNPQLAEVHAARYFIAFSQYEGWQIETAVRELRLAQEIDPNVGHTELGDLSYHIGLEQQGFDEFEVALKLDPNSDLIKGGHVTMLFQAARPDDALEANKRLFSRGPDLRYYLEKGMVKEAAPLVEEELQKNPDPDFARNQRMLLLALQGNHEEAQAFVPVFLERLRRNRGYHHYTYNVARIYASDGKSEEALKWLRITVKEGFPCYPLFERDPYLNRIRQAPEFVQFMAEIKQRFEGYKSEFAQ